MIHHRFTIQESENDYMLIPSATCEGTVVGDTASIPFTEKMAEQVQKVYNTCTRKECRLVTNGAISPPRKGRREKSPLS